MRTVPFGRRLAALAAALLGAASPTLAAQDASPPPQVPVMVRSDPRVHEVRLSVDLFGDPAANPNAVRLNNGIFGPVFRIPSAAIELPILTRTSWCDTDLTGMETVCTIDAREYKIDPGTVLSRGQTPSDASLRFSLTFPPSGVNTFGVEATYRTQRWDLAVDETAAARATWPREWTGGPERFLGKTMGIDPSDPLIRQVALEATPGGPRAVAPFVAAKNAVCAVLSRWKSVTGAASEYGPGRGLRGLGFTMNAPRGLGAGSGTPVELAVTCVAALRAIEIPSRVVYGVEIDEGRSRRDRALPTFRYICEFAIQGVGWIPFDPVQMRGSGGGNLPRDRPIRGFANVDHLRRVVPLAWRPVPEGMQQADRIAVWGWNVTDTSGIDPTLAMSRIRLLESGRGLGKPKSMPAPVGDGAYPATPEVPPAPAGGASGGPTNKRP